MACQISSSSSSSGHTRRDHPRLCHEKVVGIGRVTSVTELRKAFKRSNVGTSFWNVSRPLEPVFFTRLLQQILTAVPKARIWWETTIFFQNPVLVVPYYPINTFLLPRPSSNAAVSAVKKSATSDSDIVKRMKFWQSVKAEQLVTLLSAYWYRLFSSWYRNNLRVCDRWSMIEPTWGSFSPSSTHGNHWWA